TTVEVFRGDSANNPNCSPTAGTCGVGQGYQGVSVQVHAEGGAGIIVERPLYFSALGLGWGPINGGDVAFGANQPGTSWSFAEGNTLSGFSEYLTILNPQTSAANVTLAYVGSSGSSLGTFHLSVPPLSRSTIPVGQDLSHGPGIGYQDLSVQVTSDQAIVAERPMYVTHDFGSGPVVGGDDALGAQSTSSVFGFALASTQSGEYDFLTVQNSALAAAHLTLSYYAGGSTPVVRTLTVPATSRHTIQIFDPGEGVGRTNALIGITVSSDLPVLVEKPSYSTGASYGPAVAVGYSPPSGTF
ncbi:MAG TPA: DUF5719 family protein, partial [Candidatus Dormibacteraeota bacterium]|nr:DUF5719 family protein [Candidatus Dormibacteraeota bacterium]